MHLRCLVTGKGCFHLTGRVTFFSPSFCGAEGAGKNSRENPESFADVQAHVCY